MIIPKRWNDVQAGERVIDPAGQTFHVISRFGTFVCLAQVPSGKRFSMAIRTDDFIPTIFDVETIAIANLRKAFGQVEFLKEDK